MSIERRASGSIAWWSAPGRWWVSKVSAVRHSPWRRSSRVYGASAANRV